MAPSPSSTPGGAGRSGRRTIRPATTADAAAIGRIHVRSWQEAYRGLLPADYLAGLSIPGRIAEWRERLADPAGEVETFVIRDEAGSVLGWSSVGPARDDDLPGWGEVWAIDLAPEAWGTGAGADLFRHATRRLAEREFGTQCLWVLAGNERARRPYERFGWLPDGAEMTDERDGVTLHEVRYRAAAAGHFPHDR